MTLQLFVKLLLLHENGTLTFSRTGRSLQEVDEKIDTMSVFYNRKQVGPKPGAAQFLDQVQEIP